MEKSPIISRIQRILTPVVEGLGYELIRALIVGSGKPTLQIMAERPDGTMNVDDCEKISKAVSAVMDVENVLDSAYYLEVSSPGIDRPLTRLKDFENYTGFEAKVEIEPGIKGQKKFKGLLLATNDGIIQLKDETGTTHDIPFDRVQKAKLILTDELLKAATTAENAAENIEEDEEEAS